MTNTKIYQMAFSKVYPLLIAKAEKKGRTRDEIDQVTCWLTGYSSEQLAGFLVGDITYRDFFLKAPALCLFLQSYGLKHAEPAIGGMLLSLESVFGVVFSVIIYHERITLRMLAGFAVIFIAILLSQRDGKDAPDDAA